MKIYKDKDGQIHFDGQGDSLVLSHHSPYVHTEKGVDNVTVTNWSFCSSHYVSRFRMTWEALKFIWSGKDNESSL